MHVYNRTPHKSNNFQPPLKVFAPNLKLHLDKLKRFGSIAFINIPKPLTKFSERAIKSVMVGYSKNGYILWHPRTGKFINLRDVRFIEKLVYKDVYGKREEKSEFLETIEEEIESDENEDESDEPVNSISFGEYESDKITREKLEVKRVQETSNQKIAKRGRKRKSEGTME